MPPVFKFTKEEIISKAFEIVRKEGISALTARKLGKALDSSPKVIFGSFSGMDEVKEGVLIKARDLYSEKMMAVLKDRSVLHYIACPLCYVKFASEEKHLFEILYMTDRKKLPESAEDNTLEGIYSSIMNGLGVDRDTAMVMHSKFSIFTHGLAVFAYTSQEKLDEENAKKLLLENWEDLVHRYTGK